MFRSVGWIMLVLAIGAGVHFALQGIIQSGDAEKRKGPDMAKLERLQAVDPARAAVVRAGMDKYESICRLCHHRLGIGGKFTPAITGRPEEWVAAMLIAYRAGSQIGPLTDLMAPWAKDLSDEEIKNLAAYVSTL
ncbi:MAG: c-type cytochrome [Sulfuritalea sp.]|nr:c-type cytochrome [Sulfuritalea sp.]